MNNSRTRIKICGITRVEDALHAAFAGADSIGLMFHAPSPRSIDIAAALKIRKALPPFVCLTALFLDEEEDWIAQVVDQVRPDCLQFHGSESADTCSAWGRPYIKAIPMAGELDPGAYARGYASAQGFLLDSHASGRRGGSGDTFDWSKIPPTFEFPLVLAGGLKPSNVAEAIARVRPWGVDVSSGVESPVAVKNIDLIDQFIKEVNRGDSLKNAS